MNKQNTVLKFEDLLNTYKFKIPRGKFENLKLRKWVPLLQYSYLAKKSSYMVGKIMGDGNLDNKFTCRFVGQLKDLNRLKDLIIRDYSIREESIAISFRKNVGSSYLLQINDSLFGRFLYALGAPIGNKTKKEFLIPNWVLQSQHNQQYFLQGIFEDELSTIKMKRRRYVQEATFRMAKTEKYQKNLRKFLSQIKNLTESLSVQCSKIGKPYLENVKEDGTKTFSQCFRILGNRDNIINFKKSIGFLLNENKIIELEKCIDYIKECGSQDSNLGKH